MAPLLPERVETERLELTAMTTDSVDVLEYYRICSGAAAEDLEAVTEYLTWDAHDHPKETLEFLEHVEQKRQAGDGTEYLIRPKHGDRAGEIAGATGLTVDWDRRTATPGMWLRKPFWGRGYSGERAAALIELAFERLDLELVAVEHVEDNEKSRRAIEKYVDAHGGSRDGLLRNWDPSDDPPRNTVRYSISREEYDRAREGSAIVASH